MKGNRPSPPQDDWPGAHPPALLRRAAVFGVSKPYSALVESRLLPPDEATGCALSYPRIEAACGPLHPAALRSSSSIIPVNRGIL